MESLEHNRKGSRPCGFGWRHKGVVPAALFLLLFLSIRKICKLEKVKNKGQDRGPKQWMGREGRKWLRRLLTQSDFKNLGEVYFLTSSFLTLAGESLAGVHLHTSCLNAHRTLVFSSVAMCANGDAHHFNGLKAWANKSL